MSKNKNVLTLRRKEAISGYVFIAPWIIGFVIFFALNFFESIRYSFSSIAIKTEGGSEISFVGLENYIHIFTKHATFNRTLAESIGFMGIDVPLITFFSLFIALILNRKFKFRGLVRAIFFLPVIMATSAITSAIDDSLRSMMGGITNIPDQMQTTTGLNINYVINQFSRYGVPVWLIEYVMVAVSRIYDIIKASGVQILIFLAALQSIPGSMYEVAQIEGATAYETFWKITFPMVSPLILTNVIYTIVDSYTNSDIVQMAYDTAFVEYNFGISASMSLISAICACIVLVITGAIISVYTFYQN